MSLADQLLLILGMAAVTYASRVAPLVFLSSRDLNPLLLRWLEMVPPAVLAALLAQDVLLQKTPDGPALFISPENLFLPATAAAITAGWLFRGFFGTVAAGMVTLAVLRLFFTA